MNGSISYTLDAPAITDVLGFECAGIASDIRGKGDDRLDLCLIYSPMPCVGAGVFTTNDLKAPPVILSQENLSKQSHIQAIIANSGNANACTGKLGYENAKRMTSKTAKLLGLKEEMVLVASTGKIGISLPVEKIERGIEKAVIAKSRESAACEKAIQSILTSDTSEKSVTARITWQGQTITIGAIAKGAGMIQPNMATMLAFLLTDAAIEQSLLQSLLSKAVAKTFNTITVDGDMSTNDTVLIMANGASGVKVPKSDEEPLYSLFEEAITQVCSVLAEKIVGDGERITKVIEVNVEGARKDADAEAVARAIGNSLLIKASWYGGDPNWGRLVDAAGYAGVGIRESALDIDYATRLVPDFLAENLGISPDQPYERVVVLKKGEPHHQNKPLWKKLVGQKQFAIHLNLNSGEGHFRLLTTDLTEEYVNFNTRD